MGRVNSGSSDGAGYRQKARDGFEGRCERCGEETGWADIEVHHVDRDRSNASLDNLERLCKECHYDEHHRAAGMWGLLVSLPRPVLEAIDHEVEREGYDSRSEVVNRALARTLPDPDGASGSLGESVSAWFGSPSSRRWVNERALDDNGRPADQNNRP